MEDGLDYLYFTGNEKLSLAVVQVTIFTQTNTMAFTEFFVLQRLFQ